MSCLYYLREVAPCLVHDEFPLADLSGSAPLFATTDAALARADESDPAGPSVPAVHSLHDVVALLTSGTWELVAYAEPAYAEDLASPGKNVVARESDPTNAYSFIAGQAERLGCRFVPDPSPLRRRYGERLYRDPEGWLFDRGDRDGGLDGAYDVGLRSTSPREVHRRVKLCHVASGWKPLFWRQYAFEGDDEVAPHPDLLSVADVRRVLKKGDFQLEDEYGDLWAPGEKSIAKLGELLARDFSEVRYGRYSGIVLDRDGNEFSVQEFF